MLCAEEAGWITGQLIAADGGMSLMDPALPLAIQQPELQPAYRFAWFATAAAFRAAAA